MTRVKFFKIIALILIVLLFTCGCKESKPTQGSGNSPLSIYPAMVEMPAGENIQLLVKDDSEAVQNTDIEWVSSDPGIAEISPEGMVNAISEGEAIIDAALAKDNDKQGRCRVIVHSDGPILLYETDRIDPVESSNTPIGSPAGSGTQGSAGGGGLPGGGGGQSNDPPDVPNDPPDTPDKPQDDPGSETAVNENIPVEHDPEVDLPTEIDPKQDEFEWFIKVDKKVEKDIESPDVPMKVIYHLKLNAKKYQGKNCRGTYLGQAELHMKIDTSEITKQVMENTQGKMSKFQINIEQKFEIPLLTFDVVKFNLDDVLSHLGDTTDYTKEEIIFMESLGKLTAGGGMALDSFSAFTQGKFSTSTLDSTGIGLDYEKVFPSPGEMSYRMDISSDGRVTIDIYDLQITFDGQLTRKKCVP